VAYIPFNHGSKQREDRDLRLAEYRAYMKVAHLNSDHLLVGAYPKDFKRRLVEQGEVIRGPERYVTLPLTIRDAL
jgi:hypothetical protein